MRTKIYIVLALCFCLSKTFAQSYEDQYLQEETTRLNQAQIIENEILNFINQNINTYDFTDIINSINNVKDENGNSLTGDRYQALLLDAKKQKLRDVFFQQNPEKLRYFYATPLKQQCVNGGFENGTAAGFSFTSNKYPAGYQAFNTTPTSVISASPGSKATIVDNFSNDPLVGIPRVNNGRYAIRLNNNIASTSQSPNSPPDYYHITKMTRQFVVNENNISFAFALVLQNAGQQHISSNTNPYYQVILKNGTQTIFQRNVMGDPANPLFQQSGSILFTNWLCERIDTSNFIGQTLTLEIILGDCGQGGHWGYAYFDDFCGFNCPISSFNPSITLNPIKENNCPSFPFPVTGSFTLPPNAILSNIMLLVNNAANNANISSQTITTATGGNFSFNLTNASFYPTGPSNITNFNILAQLNYTINGIPQNTVVVFNTNPPGPDVSFNNCPIPCAEEWRFETNQPITSSANYYAFGSIYSASAIYPNIDVEFRAAYDIQLTNGFYATAYNTGNFHAYIAPCNEGDQSKTQKDKSISDIKSKIINSDIKIFPNPASTYINIDAGNEKITAWELLDNSGKNILKGTSNQINVQSLPQAMYLLKINTVNRQVTKKVLVK